MKILILGFTKLKYMPYMNFYLDNIDKETNDVHLLYWNRDCKEEDISKYKTVILHEFSCYQQDEVSKISKIKSFLKYRYYVKSLLREVNFDFIIVLHTLPGILIFDKLIKRYKSKYILDYRDYTYESNPFFKRIIHALARHARLTFVSSDAYRRFLPRDAAIHTSHNLLIDSLSHREEREKNRVSPDKIRIAFWGFIRHADINLKIIERLANDDRFELHYYGREQETALKLKEYTRKISATNVFFHGEYKPEDKYEFVRKTDIIHNIYYDTNTMLAMGNKYYDGLIFYLPQLCMKESYMGVCASKAGVGFECSPYSDSFTNDIYEYYSKIDWAEFRNKCDEELERVKREYENGSSIVKQISGS